MKLGIEVIWIKGESDGELYHSELKMKYKGEEFDPKRLFQTLSKVKINNVLFFRYMIDTDDDPCVCITNGNTYESDYIYLKSNSKCKEGISETPTVEDVENLMKFFGEIDREIGRAIANLKAETLTYRF